MRQAVYVGKTRPALYQVRQLKPKERIGMKYRLPGLTQPASMVSTACFTRFYFDVIQSMR